jgi:KDO2-lipid IV(A) lauroyltransferase
MKGGHRAIQYSAYLLVRMLAAVLAMFPIEASLRLMRSLGWVWFSLPHALPETHIPPAMARLPIFKPLVGLTRTTNKLLMKFREHRNRAEGHIRLAFPEMMPDEVSATALKSMQQLAMLAVEVLMTPALITRWTWPRHIRLGKLDEALRVLLQKRGCIMLTGHYGNWELLGFALATLGFEVTAVMRPLDNEYLNSFLLDRRERSGLRLLYKKGATRSAGDVIDSGGAICFIADQNAGSKGLFVDFFGRKASTYKSIGLLAMEHRVPIVVGCARRTSERFEYEVSTNRIIHPHEWDEQPDALMWITNEFSRAMEEFVRVAPEQYLWIHRRWKSRPKEELEAMAATA